MYKTQVINSILNIRTQISKWAEEANEEGGTLLELFYLAPPINDLKPYHYEIFDKALSYSYDVITVENTNIINQFKKTENYTIIETNYEEFFPKSIEFDSRNYCWYLINAVNEEIANKVMHLFDELHENEFADDIEFFQSQLNDSEYLVGIMHMPLTYESREWWVIADEFYKLGNDA